MKTVVVGLILACLLLMALSTKLGRTIVVVALAMAMVGACFYINTHWAAPHPVKPNGGEFGVVGDLIALAVVALIFGSLIVQLYRAGVRTMRERRERAKRLWALEHPLDGEILPPQRYLSP